MTRLTVQFIIVFAALHPVVEAAVQKVTPSPYRKVERIRLSEVKWTGGFWKHRYATCRDKMVPSMWEIMKGKKYKPFLEHFRIAAGLADGDYHGAQWNDGDFYKWMEAVCALQAVEDDPEWDRLLDEIIAVVGKAQRSDGYIHTPILVAIRNGDKDAKPFADRFNFEMYNMGHLMTAACLHHEVTGKSEFLAIACKAGDFLDAAFGNPTGERARHAVCPSHYMGIIDLYRTTGEPRYLELANRLVRMRDLVVAGGDDNQDRVPLARQTEAVGHAVRATYLYAGIADLYAETGDAELWSSLETTVADGNRILEQKTDYPWDGEIRITVLQCGPTPVRLKLRIPGWAKSARLKIDGMPASVATIPGTYATIQRIWRPGTTIHLQIPMPPQLLESHPLVEETRNHVAIKRGPVVYCLESIDLPRGRSLADIRIPSDIEFEPRFEAGWWLERQALPRVQTVRCSFGAGDSCSILYMVQSRTIRDDRLAPP